LEGFLEAPELHNNNGVYSLMNYHIGIGLEHFSGEVVVGQVLLFDIGKMSVHAFKEINRWAICCILYYYIYHYWKPLFFCVPTTIRKIWKNHQKN